MPVLVFRKTGDAADERQRDFIARVGEYQGGRFWKEFRDSGDLAVAVVDVLREVAEEAAPLRWEPVDPEPVVRWLTDRPGLADRMRMSTSGPVRTSADAKVAAAALPAAIPEIARELAARILAELRTRR